LFIGPGILVAVVALWLLWAWAASRLTANPRHDALYGLGLLFTRLYTRLVHGLRAHGTQHIPADLAERGLLVVVNHTAGVDPVLVQAAFPHEIRWMMARDMMTPALAAWWDWLGVIPVERSGPGKAGSDAAAAREAIRHLKSGGVVGLFPEGGLERPPCVLRPFAPGVGLIARKGNARILPVVVEGTPQTHSAWGSLSTPSRSRVTFLPIIDPTACKRSAEEITADLMAAYQRATGWPIGSGAATENH
jgi:1-acyl-sn-glycerol-3-phosphate acyltransferase